VTLTDEMSRIEFNLSWIPPDLVLSLHAGFFARELEESSTMFLMMVRDDVEKFKFLVQMVLLPLGKDTSTSCVHIRPWDESWAFQ
jgi:hypothetical protein